MDKSVVLIDAGYLSKVLDHEFNRARIDFVKFSDALCEGSERLRTYYYTCMPYQHNPPTEDEKQRFARVERFHRKLRTLPRIEVRLGKLGYTGGDYVQKRVDILLAVDLVRMSWDKQIEKAILVAGDSDFIPAIDAAKDAGVIVQLHYSQNSIHHELLEEVDDHFQITKELIESCRLR